VPFETGADKTIETAVLQALPDFTEAFVEIDGRCDGSVATGMIVPGCRCYISAAKSLVRQFDSKPVEKGGDLQ
jgi:hypothetical protein